MNTLICIGGMPRCGKTSLAKYLLHQYDIPFYSTDTLCNLIHACFPESGVNVNLPLEQKIQTFEPILKMLVKTLSFQNGMWAIEGDVITPGFVALLHHQCTLKSVFLGDSTASLENYRKRSGGEYDWLSEKSEDELEKIVADVRRCSTFYKQECSKYGLLYRELSPTDFNKQLEVLSARLVDGE